VYRSTSASCVHGISCSVVLAPLPLVQVSGILVCEAGCILETLDAFVNTKG